jgi:hypothetical protein
VTAPTVTSPAATPADPLREALARARAAADRVRAERGPGDTGPEDPRIAAAEMARDEPDGDADRAASDAYEAQRNRQGGEF